jgi:glyoxylase-like metal-dependent hydrolase (beta-lactamase superfamily II)
MARMKDCGASKVKRCGYFRGESLLAGGTSMQAFRDARFPVQATTGATAELARGLQRVVASNPSALTGPGTNTYVITAADGCLVVDPGPDDHKHIANVVRAANGRVRAILCSHSHTDHSPGAATLQRLTGAPVFGRPAPDDGYQDETYAPDGSLEDGQAFGTDAGTLRVLHTPGHASNHVCFVLEPQGWLLTGDHLMDGSTVVILPPDGSMRLYLDSLRRLRTLRLDALLPGHGAAILDPLVEIDRVMAHRLQREGKVADALRRQPAASLDMLLPEVYADTPAALHGLARYSLLAHLQKLLEEGRAGVEGTTWTWREQ